MRRRQLLGACGTGLAIGTAGCVGTIPFVGDEPIEFAAAAPSIPQAALDDTGYEEQEPEEIVLTPTVEAAGQTQEIVIRNWRAEYDKSVDLEDLGLPVDQGFRAATLGVLTTPQVRLLGETFNPVADMDSAELAELAQDRYESVNNVEKVGEREAEVAGTTTTVGEFEAEAELIAGNIAVDLAMCVAEAVESGDDLVVAVGAYPLLIEDTERENVTSLMAAIEHDG